MGTDGLVNLVRYFEEAGAKYPANDESYWDAFQETLKGYLRSQGRSIQDYECDSRTVTSASYQIWKAHQIEAGVTIEQLMGPFHRGYFEGPGRTWTWDMYSPVSRTRKLVVTRSDATSPYSRTEAEKRAWAQDTFLDDNGFVQWR